MRRWIAAIVLVVVPLLNGCCCCNSGCGYRLFCRPCMFGQCGGRCGYGYGGGCGYGAGCGYGGFYDGGGTGYSGCSSCYGNAPGGYGYGAAPVGGIPMAGSTAPPVAGPMMTAPQIEKLSAASNVPTRVMR